MGIYRTGTNFTIRVKINKNAKIKEYFSANYCKFKEIQK